jgi:hypothetical protein
LVIALSGRYEQILNYVISMDFLFFGLTVRRDMLVGGCEYDLPLSSEQPHRFRSAAGGHSGVLVLEPASSVAVCRFVTEIFCKREGKT